MKKILLLYIDDKFCEQLLQMTLAIAKKNKTKVTALFAGNLSLGEIFEQASLFENSCKMLGLPFQTKNINENILDTIIDETAFADLIICDGTLDMRYFSTGSFIASAHCPVLLVPTLVPLFENVIFTYDGHLSSIYAIKQFSYIFHMFEIRHVYMLSVIPPNILEVEYDSLVREWILLYYPEAIFSVLRGDIENEMTNFINSVDNSLVVMGSYGRSVLSRLFKESLAPVILGNTRTPIFISHL